MCAPEDASRSSSLDVIDLAMRIGSRRIRSVWATSQGSATNANTVSRVLRKAGTAGPTIKGGPVQDRSKNEWIANRAMRSARDSGAEIFLEACETVPSAAFQVE